jgi:DNA-binding transcriptional MerR regulator
MQQRFTSNRVAALTGMTPRQLQWLDERGIVVPQREGHKRLYSFDNLAEVAVIGELRERGFSLQRVRKVMSFLQREFGKRLVETVSGGSDYHLLTDGKHIYLKTSPQQIVEVLKNARQPMFAICLSDAVRQVQAEVSGNDLVPPPCPAPSGENNGGSGQSADHRQTPKRRGPQKRQPAGCASERLQQRKRVVA